MAIIKWIQLIKRISFLLAIGLSFTIKNMNALHVAPKSRLTLEQQERQSNWFLKQFALNQDEYRVCGDGVGIVRNSIKVKEKALKLSNVIKNILESPDADINDKNIPINAFPITVIKNSFNLLSKSLESNGLKSIEKQIESYPLDKLITTFNCIHYLHCPNVEDVFLSIIKEKITKNNGLITTMPVFQQLNPDAQRLIMIKPVLNFLDSKSLKKRKLYLESGQVDINSVAFSPDGSKIVSGSYGPRDNLIFWDVASGNRIHDFARFDCMVNSVAFSPDGSKIVSGSRGTRDNLILWDVASGNRIHNLVGHTNNVSLVAFSPDGSKIISGGHGFHANLMLWDVASGHRIHNFVGHKYTVNSIAFSSDGSKIISASTDDHDNLMLWDVASGNIIHNFVGHRSTVNSVAFSPDDSKVISGSYDARNNIMLWDVASGDKIHTFSNHSDVSYSVTFSPGGSKIISGSRGPRDSLILWDVASGHRVHTLRRHSDFINSVAFSPDGSKIISAGIGDCGNLILWDVASGHRIHNFTGHTRTVRSVAFSPDNSKIIAAGDDDNHNNLILWSMLSQQEKNIVEKCTVEQTVLLYRLSLTQQNTALKLNATDQKLFDSLPSEIRKLLPKRELATDKQTWLE